MLVPKEDMKWLERKFQGALFVFIYPLLWLFEQTQNTFNSKFKQGLCFVVLGLFFWIGVGYVSHSVILYLVESFVHP